MGTQLPFPKGAQSPIFGTCLLWPNGCMYQDTTWYGGRPQPRQHCATWGPSSPPLKGHSPQFSANVPCDQTAVCIKMPLAMEVGLSPGDFVLDGYPAPTPKGAEPHPIFGRRLSWPNDCMDQDATWYGGRPRPTKHCVRCGPSYPQKKAHPLDPIFGSCLLWPNGWMDDDAAWYGSRARPRPHCITLY